MIPSAKILFRCQVSCIGPQLCPPCALKCPNPGNDPREPAVGSEELAHMLILSTSHALLLLAPLGLFPGVWESESRTKEDSD